MSWPPLKDQCLSWLFPSYLLYESARSFFVTAFHFYILLGNFPSALNLKKVRDEAFSTCWTKLTAPVVPPPPPVGSAALVPPLLSHAHGVVLDIGPGSGSDVSSFSDNANITAIYGAEPVVGLHPPLQNRIDDAKLTDKYHILASTADKKELLAALAKEGVKPSSQGVFDTIVCIRVLCSVPNLDETARELYSLLRPGGEMIVVEHIKNPWTKNGSIPARLAQIIYTALGWKFFMGGCDMSRDTAPILKRAGPWEAIDLKTHFEWAALPYVSGTLTKRK